MESEAKTCLEERILKLSSFRIGSLLVLFFLFIPVCVPVEAVGNKEAIRAIPDENGVRVVFSDVELYFNASNGGEITEYYDLSLDPLRSRNLVNISLGRPFYNLFPLFTSCFYNSYKGIVLSAGGDSDATVALIANTSEYIILQSSSRIMSHTGLVAKDSEGNPIYMNTTWVIHSNGSFFIERTFCAKASVLIPQGWRWYPFYLTRVMGFSQNGTFYLFNTTYMSTHLVDDETYINKYSHFPIIPTDERGVFGIAVPFSNTTVGGDGGHSIIIAYRHRELMDANEWRSDNFHSAKHQVTESGPVHEFEECLNVSSHTYHMQVKFTHQPVHDGSVKEFAVGFANYTRAWSLLECAVITEKTAYFPGEKLVIQANGTSYYNITNIIGKLLITDTNGEIVYAKHYGPTNLNGGQTFSKILFNQIVQPRPGNYTATFQIYSSAGILIASDSTAINVI